MPTLNFTPDNTAPVAKSAAAGAPDNTAPVAKSSAAGAPNNTAPVAKSSVAAAPDNTAPVAKSSVASAPDNTAPVAITSAFTPDNTAPVAKSATAAAPDNTAPGAKNAPTNNGTNEPPQPIAQDPLLPATDNTVNTPSIDISGILVAARIYGWARMSAACSLVRVQVQLNEAPAGADAILELVDSDGEPLGVEVTVADGAKFGELVLSEPLALLNGANLRAKCTQTGTGDTPGGFGAVTLFLQLA